MAARELVVLGTASQVPTRRRNHNGYVLRWDGATFLFDPGEGTQRQMLLADVTAPSIDRICITHAHGDHCLGLPGVLLKRAVDEAIAPVTLHYPAPSGADLAPLVWGEVVDVPVHPELGLHEVAADEKGRWRLLAAPLDHRTDTVGYRVEEPDGVTMLPEALAAHGIAGPDVGRLQREGRLETPDGVVALEQVSEPRRGQSFAFVMDTRLCRGAVELAAGADVLVVESTYLHRDADLAEQYGHLTALQAGALAATAGVRRLVLTHFSRRYGDDGAPFAAEAAREFPEVTAVEDLDVVEIPPRR